MVTKVNNRMIDGAAVNVLDFGAVGDGVTDDTIAIQSALLAAEGREVQFPKGVYRVTSSLATPARTEEYGLQLRGAASGQCIIDFDLSASADVDGIYLSHRPADPVDYDDPTKYTGAVIQRNIRIQGLTIRNSNQIASPAGTRQGSGLFLYYASLVTVVDVICQGWGRGIDCWLWASKVETSRFRECDVGAYIWTGTTLVFQNTYAGSCQTGYLIGGDKNTFVGSNTDTPGVQNPYPPHRPVSVLLLATACDATSTHAYYVNDAANVTFDTCSAEGTGLGMFNIDKNNGSVSIVNPNHSTIYGIYTESRSFLRLGNGYCDVELVNTKLDGVYTTAVLESVAIAPYYDGSVIRMTKYKDFTTGAGASVIQPLVQIEGAQQLPNSTIRLSIPLEQAKLPSQLYTSATFEVTGTLRAGGAAWLGGYNVKVTTLGQTGVGGTGTAFTSQVDWAQVYAPAGQDIDSISVTAVSTDDGFIYLDFELQANGAPQTIDALQNRASFRQLTAKYD